MSAKGRSSDASRLSQPSRFNVPAPSPTPENHHQLATAAGAVGERKHDAYAMEGLLKPSIVVKPHPSKITTKPRSLQPLMLLPRDALTLSYLDLAAPSGDFEYARQYESTVKILDLESRMDNRPVVLIARMETSQTVYAIERQASNLYTLCKIGHWVDLEKLSTHANVAYSKLLKTRPVIADAIQPEAATTPQLHQDNKKRRLAMEAIQSLVRRPARSQSMSLSSQAVDVTQDATMAGAASLSQASDPVKVVRGDTTSKNAKAPFNDMAPSEEAPGPHTAKEIFDNVRTQYFEALYHSMGSLAYFVKGPLSRARAAFHLDCDSNLDVNELVSFLKGFVLTTVHIDKKYRHSVPEIISKFKTHIADSGDDQEPKAKKKKTQKMKIGKNALYPTEDEHVRKWWDTHKPQLKEDDDSTATGVPQKTRLQISCLRSRETQLQMILILEIMAIEPLTSTTSAVGSQLPGLSIKDKTPEFTKEPLVKKRNKHNLPMLLDVHADRLSIWQTTSLDEIKVMDDSHAGRSIVAQKSDKFTTDPLKDFCIDIIVPFFSSRLPDRCNLLTQKLGGLVIPSPPKPMVNKAEEFTKPISKPGAVTKRPATSKPTRTLDRVLSKEVERNRRSISRGPGSMIALMRSATTPLPTLKREASDLVSLTDLPTKNEKDRKISLYRKSSITVSESARRGTQEEKAKKEAEIETELQVAISGLRKPNREVVVGRALAEADERKATTSLSQLKKSRKPTEHPGTHSIIKATPAGPRFRNALTRESHNQPVMGSIYGTVEAEDFPSSPRRIPSTAFGNQKIGAAFVDKESSPTLPAVRQPLESINATPVRPSLKRSFTSAPAIDEGIVLASSPVAVRKFLAVPGGGLKHRDSGIGMHSPPGGCLAETPVKRPRFTQRGSLEGFVTVTPVKKRVVNNVVATLAQPKLFQEQQSTRKPSIFEKLGWNDDYDELL